MHTVIINGSPNKEGSTSQIIKHLLKGLEGKISVINVYEKDIKPCIDCKYCYSKFGECYIKDYMTLVYKTVDDCDNIIIVSPMYFASFPAPMKALIDRFQMFWSRKYRFNYEHRRKKRGILIITAGNQWPNMFLPMQKMTEYLFKSLDTKLVDCIFIPETDTIPVLEREDTLRKVYEIGRRLELKEY